MATMVKRTYLRTMSMRVYSITRALNLIKSPRDVVFNYYLLLKPHLLIYLQCAHFSYVAFPSQIKEAVGVGF